MDQMENTSLLGLLQSISGHIRGIVRVHVNFVLYLTTIRKGMLEIIILIKGVVFHPTIVLIFRTSRQTLHDIIDHGYFGIDDARMLCRPDVVHLVFPVVTRVVLRPGVQLAVCSQTLNSQLIEMTLIILYVDQTSERRVQQLSNHETHTEPVTNQLR